MQQAPRTGFTFIEVLIVIAIIALLAVVIVVAVRDAQLRSRDAKRLADVRQIQKAVELYFGEMGSYPLTTNNTNETWSELAVTLSAYLSALPIDPINNDNNGSYVYTYGANSTGTAYFIAAKLEDTAQAALNGDNDSLYNLAWSAYDAVESNDESNELITNFDCGLTVLDSTAGHYCLSE